MSYSVGDSAYLKEPQYYKGYHYVEVVEIDGDRLLVRTDSGWEFTVDADELED